MKDSNEYAAALKQLCGRLKRSGGKTNESSVNEPVTELVLAALSVATTESRARSALGRLRGSFVDFNELRVARVEEITDVLGKSFPQAKEAATRITTLLQSICEKNDTLNVSHLQEGGKREAKIFFESLVGQTPYIVARVMLLSLQAHAFPVNEQMLLMLRDEGAIAPKADTTDVQGFLERQISANEIRETYGLLRAHADSFKPSRAAKNTAKNTTAGSDTGTKNRKTKKKTTKATSRKKTASERTVKKKVKKDASG